MWLIGPILFIIFDILMLLNNLADGKDTIWDLVWIGILAIQMFTTGLLVGQKYG